MPDKEEVWGRGLLMTGDGGKHVEYVIEDEEFVLLANKFCEWVNVCVCMPGKDCDAMFDEKQHSIYINTDKWKKTIILNTQNCNN